jgi:hypothetical protein
VFSPRLGTFKALACPHLDTRRTCSGLGHTQGHTVARQRVNVQEAAEHLGTGVEALRKRIARGTVDSERDEDGRVYVWIDPPDGDRSLGQTVSASDSHQAILEAKDETIELLRRELEMWQEESRRKDHFLAALTERIPELEPARETPSEATPEPRESPVSAEGLPYGTSPQEAQESLHKRSWWQRWFGA